MSYGHGHTAPAALPTSRELAARGPDVRTNTRIDFNLAWAGGAAAAVIGGNQWASLPPDPAARPTRRPRLLDRTPTSSRTRRTPGTRGARCPWSAWPAFSWRST